MMIMMMRINDNNHNKSHTHHIGNIGNKDNQDTNQTTCLSSREESCNQITHGNQGEGEDKEVQHQ